MPENKYSIENGQIWALRDGKDDVLVGVCYGGQVYCKSLRKSMQFDQDVFISRYYLKEDKNGNVV